jgi:hypothetical protein
MRTKEFKVNKTIWWRNVRDYNRVNFMQQTSCYWFFVIGNYTYGMQYIGKVLLSRSILRTVYYTVHSITSAHAKD